MAQRRRRPRRGVQYAAPVQYGAESMTAPLREVLVKRPAEAFAHAHEDRRHGFLHAVDLVAAQREHDRLCQLLESLGARVHRLESETASPDLVYTFDPALVTQRGYIALRSGKPTRRGEEQALAAWLDASGIPRVGAIEAPGTVDGGDTFWLEPGLLCVGRSLRTNGAGVEQLGRLVERVLVFDVPYAGGPGECLHLMSLVSPVADDLAVVYLPLLPCGLYELLHERGVRLVEVPDEEFASLGCNVLAVRPGVVVIAAGNPRTQAALEAAGCEVHTFAAGEVGLNGSGGPTCLTRPILRR
jgi:N-dimethylarginine dimethylaminohydrolase